MKQTQIYKTCNRIIQQFCLVFIYTATLPTLRFVARSSR